MIDCHQLGLVPQTLCGADRNLVLYHQGKELISIIMS